MNIMKTIFIALGMAVVLFIYGYVLSTAGHDHGHHEAVSYEKAHNSTDHGGHPH